MRCNNTFWSCDAIGSSIGIMLIVLSMAPLHSLGQDDENEVQHNLSVHVMPLALASVSNDANSIINGTTTSLMLRTAERCNVTSLVMWFYWHQHHMMETALPMKPLHSSGQDDWNEVQCKFWSCDNIGICIMWHQWHWHHMMPIASSMAPLHSLDQDDQNEVQHDLFGHVMPSTLALASHDDDGVINGIIAFH